jgi:hypothetical protein
VLRLPLERELSAATAVAAEAGLGVVRPDVLHLGNHTSVRLSPWPIVARIGSGTSFDFSPGTLARELAVGRHLAACAAPAVRPTAVVPPGPYIHGDCAVTMWEFLEGRALVPGDDEFMAAASLRLIHSALATLNVELPSFLTKVESCESILVDPAEATSLPKNDRVFLQERYETLRKDLSCVGGKWQPLHGDTHLGNVLIGDSGAIWMDLEAACQGPREWDIVNLPVGTWLGFGELDAALLRLFAEVRSLCVAVWCWAEFDRSAATAEAANYHLKRLKTHFV